MAYQFISQTSKFPTIQLPEFLMARFMGLKESISPYYFSRTAELTQLWHPRCRSTCSALWMIRQTVTINSLAQSMITKTRNEDKKCTHIRDNSRHCSFTRIYIESDQ